MNFADRLTREVKKKKTPLVVGIDPRIGQLPAEILNERSRREQNGQTKADADAWAFESFSCGIIDVVAAHVPAVKPQMAFFEELGPAGMVALGRVIDHAQNTGLIVILDGKRNDIGTTGEAYAAAYLGRRPKSPWGADSLTINPWMGYDTLTPFVNHAQKNDAGLFVLVKTSNPGSRDLQEQECGGRRLFEQVAAQVDRLSAQTRGACGYGIVGAVVGATFPQQLADLRRAMPHTLFLVPGFGAQGGSAADVAGAFDQHGLGAVVNSSRGINFAFANPQFRQAADTSWQKAVERATIDAVDRIASDTKAGRLRS
ncbi:MAG: orotidine-5'-phosphate decarboxylase [Pirellulaceae bacterium]